MNVTCSECSVTQELTPEQWRCPCGGAWEPLEQVGFDPELIDQTDPTIWRYRRLYGLDFDVPSVRLGAGGTPLLPIALKSEILVKPEYFGPS